MGHLSRNYLKRKPLIKDNGVSFLFLMSIRTENMATVASLFRIVLFCVDFLLKKKCANGKKNMTIGMKYLGFTVCH